MRLVLRATDGNGGPSNERQLDQGTLTLGRGAENDWTIPDPERTLSKLHCRIDSSGDGFVITDQSTNGVFINDDPQPIGRGRSRALADGDFVTLGPARLAVSIVDDAATPQPIPATPGGFDGDFDAELPGSARPAALMPFSGVHHAPESPIATQHSEPWLEAIPGGEFGPDRHVRAQGWDTPPDPADFAASGVRTASHPLDSLPVEFSHGSEHAAATATVMKLPSASAATMLPTDWNDTDPMAGANLAPSPIEALQNARPGQSAPAAAPSPFDSIEIPGEDLLAPPVPLLEPAPPPIQVAAPELDVQQRDAPAPTEPLPPLEFEPVEPPKMADSSPVAGQAATAAPLEEAGLLDAFLEGAGLTRDAIAGLSEAEIGRNLGHMLRDAVEGVRDVLATRAMVKSELRISQTVIQASDNSALKFAPDVRRCLAAMVGQPPQGFLPGATAMLNAMSDIKRHELALVAALNSVFASMTEKLDPETILGKVRGESGLGTMLPYAREARCWAVYLENYQALQASGSENTAGSLLAPLAVAYARQIRPADRATASTPLTSNPLATPPDRPQDTR